MSSQRFIYFFGEGRAEGGSAIKHLVGGKGASLADMTKAGLNVPPGFTISAECCDLYYQSGKQWPPGLEAELRINLTRLERVTGRTFGRGADPLLVAVRSGAAQSMPGMMDTVLNVGLNPECVRELAARTGNLRGAWQAYRHFLTMFGHTVGGIDESKFAYLSEEFLQQVGKKSEEELDAGQIESLCERFQMGFHLLTGREVPSDPFESLRLAIDAVFNSWNSERAVTYRQHHHIEGLLGTAVNIQAMCPSEVSGVMFTAHPVNPALDQVIIESSFGLGEAIVLGKVTPDRFSVDKKTCHIKERVISRKDQIITALTADEANTPTDKEAASLSDAQVSELARLGLRVESYFRHPCDIEWGLSRGTFYLLQTRPIKLKAGAPGPEAAAIFEPAEVERVRLEEIANLKLITPPEGTVWSRYNLSEVLPEPTPMTWAVVRRFMSGKGGFGQMYRDLGFDPDPALDEVGIFDLICGRPYCNLSREPRMQYRTLPFEHPFAALKANPHKALYPQAVLNPARAGWRFWLFLPAVVFKLIRSSRRLRKASRSFAQRFRDQIVPPFLEEVNKEESQDYAALPSKALLERFHYWVHRTLFDFARESLKPTALAAVAMGNLERALASRLPPLPSEEQAREKASGLKRAQAVLRELVMGVRPEPESDLPGAMRDLAMGKLDRQVFLERFGHRGRQEMELARPRWSEDPAAVEELVRALGPESGEKKEVGLAGTWEALALEARLSAGQRAALEKELNTLQTYLSLRETAKHHLMRGYAIIRRILVELDRRYNLNGGLFFLTPDELPRLVEANHPRELSRELLAVIEQRRRRRAIALSLPMPQVLFSDDLEAIGRAVETAKIEALQGVPLSAGIAEGIALVLQEPTRIGLPAEPYILVCPSTDPAWVPLFVQACGLIMETGGVLSHGAIVAREFGLPAVAGLPDVHRRLRTGQRLRVDGATGKVNVLE
jgi:phosphohistidine swiveling domain-containing protein